MFAAQFYSAIWFGLSVQRALQQVRATLTLEGIAEEDTPELLVALSATGDEIALVRPPSIPSRDGA